MDIWVLGGGLEADRTIDPSWRPFSISIADARCECGSDNVGVVVGSFHPSIFITPPPPLFFCSSLLSLFHPLLVCVHFFVCCVCLCVCYILTFVLFSFLFFRPTMCGSFRFPFGSFMFWGKKKRERESAEE